MIAIALALRDRVDLPPSTRYRLVGVGFGGFRDPSGDAGQRTLFAFGAEHAGPVADAAANVTADAATNLDDPADDR